MLRSDGMYVPSTGPVQGPLLHNRLRINDMFVM